MSDDLPDQKKPKLIVVMAFDRGDDGDLFTAYGPTDQQSEDRAIRTAKALASNHMESRRRPGAWRLWAADSAVHKRRSARHGVRNDRSTLVPG